MVERSSQQRARKNREQAGIAEIWIKNIAQDRLIWLHQASFTCGWDKERRTQSAAMIDCAARAMKRSRMHIFYSGHVQGVGFRYTVRSVATGFEVTGTVRNLLDGRVELIAEGSREELEAFREAIPDAGLERFIRDESASWSEATGEFRGFEIVR
jgi:acylphosphatase